MPQNVKIPRASRRKTSYTSHDQGKVNEHDNWEDKHVKENSI